MLRTSPTLTARLQKKEVILNPGDAAQILKDGSDQAVITVNGSSFRVSIEMDRTVPSGIALVPRKLGIFLGQPRQIYIEAVLDEGKQG
jgi:hypothetical protein